MCALAGPATLANVTVGDKPCVEVAFCCLVGVLVRRVKVFLGRIGLRLVLLSA